MVKDGGDDKPGLKMWTCNGSLINNEKRQEKMSVGGSLLCSIEQEPVITSVAITTATGLTSSYVQHHCVPSHTSTTMWDYIYARYDETCTTTCAAAESSPPQ